MKSTPMSIEDQRQRRAQDAYERLLRAAAHRELSLDEKTGLLFWGDVLGHNPLEIRQHVEQARANARRQQR